MRIGLKHPELVRKSSEHAIPWTHEPNRWAKDELAMLFFAVIKMWVVRTAKLRFAPPARYNRSRFICSNCSRVISPCA